LNPLVRQLANEFVKDLIEQAAKSKNGTANAYELCGSFSFIVICKAAFNKDFTARTKVATTTTNDDEAQKLLKAMDGSALTFIFDAAMPFLRASGFATKVPGLVGDCYRNHAYWIAKSREMVDHFLSSSSQDSKYFLTPLANGLDTFLNRKLSHDEFVEEAMGMMFAGSGTTSSTLTYLLYAISTPENLHIQRTLREEVLAVEEGDMVKLRNNPYLNAVINETFRLYPTIISTLPRVLLEPLQVEKYLLPAGTIVGMQNYVHHRDARIFPEPEKFRPERWLEATEEMKGSLTPFSVGRRNCIGQNLAWEELYLAVETVMRAGVEVRLGREMRWDDMDMEDRFNIAPKGRRLMLEVVRL
jgi:cytochrome P450